MLSGEPRPTAAERADMRARWADERARMARQPSIGERFDIARAGAEPVRAIRYRPRAAAPGPLPVLFNMHGGAWVGGDAMLMESFCQMLADEIPAVVVNVNYTKADVRPYPYAIDEVVDAVRHVADDAARWGIDPSRIAVGGHSAGGQLAACAALRLRDAGIALAAQMLVYPVVDMARFCEGPNAFIGDMLFPGGGYRDAYASPLLATDDGLRGVAPAIVILCGLDDLRPQGAAYAKRLIDVGVPVNVKEYPGAEHGFLEVNRPDYPAGDSRQTPQQRAYCVDCERYLVRQLRAALHA